MPITLADLTTTPAPAPKLQDFGPSAGQPKPSTVNADTNTNIAAHGALMAPPDAVINAYNNINTELGTGGSFTLDQLLAQRKIVDQRSTYDEVQRVLADPNVSVDDKAGYMNGYIGMLSGRPGSDSLGVTIARQAAMSPSSPNETDEAVNTILPTDGSVYDSVDQYNGFVQKKINAIANSKDQNWFTKGADIVESLIPFVDQARSAQTSYKLGEIKNPGDLLKGMTLLGESRNVIRDKIAAMPVADRYALAQKVIDLVSNAKGPVFNSLDTLDKVNQLNAYLNGTGYSGKDRVSDNIFSLLDATVVLGPLLKIGKAGVEGVKASSALKRAALVENKVQEATPEIQKIAKNLQLTYQAPSGPTVFVNKKGVGSTDLGAVESPSQDVVNTTADMITDRILQKFNKPALKTPTGDTANVVDDLGGPNVDMSVVRDEVRQQVGSILTPSTFNDPDIVKKVTDGVGETLKSRYIGTPKTFKATSTQLVRQTMDESNINRLAARTTVAPTSPSQVIKDVNPEKARAIHNMAVQDQTGQAAKALYGTDRADAIANDYLPEVKNIDDSVRNKVNMDEALPNPDQRVIEAVKEKGRTDLYPAEKTAMRNKVKQDFTDVVGMVPRTPMGTLGDAKSLVEQGSLNTPQGVKFSMVYGPTDGGFVSKEQAVRQALFSLNKYGVTENEIELLGKTPEGSFVPAGKDSYPSYLVRVNHNYEFTPADTVEHTMEGGSKWNLFDSRENWTDGSMGTLKQHFVPPSVTVPAQIFNSSSAAADKSAWYGKQLLSLADRYGKKFKTLDKRQQALVDAYRVEANNKGLKFSTADLEARGMNPTAIEALRDWKTTTDTMWWMENVDANKTARARGWMRFVDQANHSDLLVKPLPNHFGDAVKDVYDSTTDSLVRLDKAQLDELYARGGSIAHTREHVSRGTKSFDLIKVENKSDSSYMRMIRDEDDTLTYRDGYYPIKYKDPYFIKQTFKKPDGTSYDKAIASAGSLKDANALRDRMLAADNKAILNIHSDYKLKGQSQFDEDNWSYMNSSGRSAQRIRGERLENATAVTDPNHVHIESPEESLIHSIRSVAGRTAYRDWVDTTKNRWLAQYGDLMDAQRGVQMWPEDIREIGKNKLQADSMRIKDAKATWAHVHAMEAGYVNLLDDASKNMFKEFSNIAGRKGWGWVENVGNKLAQGKPTSWARRKAFRLLLAANPLRQALVQGSQALPVLLATNPLAIPKIAAQHVLLNFMKTGGDADTFMKVIAQNATGLSVKEAEKMYADFEKSGFEAAVDANSLIRSQMANIVDRRLSEKVKSVTAKPLNVLQKYGFNAGENFLMRSVWLSEYDILKKSGIKIDAEALDNLSARVRNLTLNMNKAGELPYNENMFSAALQFFQAPHKAFSQIIMGHRGLTGGDRLRLGAAYVATFGIGGGPISSILSNLLPDDNQAFDTKDLIEGGLFNLTVNAGLSSIFGQTVRTDFSDSFRLLSDYTKPVMALWLGIQQGSILDTLTSGASAGLVFGDNARVTNFIKQLAKPFLVDDSQKADELMATGVAFLSMFSGASNYFKAKYAVEHGKTINSKGGVVDYHVNTVEAALLAAGFSTVDEIHQYAANDASYKATGKYKDDIAHMIDETSRNLAKKGIANDDADWYLKMMSEAQRVFGGDPVYLKEIANQLQYKASVGEDSIFKTLLQQMGYADNFDDLVNGSHLNDEQKKTLLDAKRQMDEIKNGN